jgi:hypothetical protein
MLTLTLSRTKVTCQRCVQILETKDRKKVIRKDKINLKKLEKEVTALWRRSVWLIWDGKCALCGKACNDHNAHHYFTKGVHAATKYEPYCGILLDYGCHIGKVHRGGEIEQLRDVYIGKIGQPLFDALKKQSYSLAKNVDLEKVRKVLAELISVMEHFGNGAST